MFVNAWRDLLAEVAETHFDLTRNNVFRKPLELLKFVIAHLQLVELYEDIRKPHLA